MERTEAVKRTEAHVKSVLEKAESSHDWWHVLRVWRNAVLIGKREKADMFVVELAALLHDISDWKLEGGDEAKGPRMAREWLQSIGVDEKSVSHITEIIVDISFKGTGKEKKMQTREGMVVQDADRLDAIGAIGIGRAFAFGGHVGRPLYEPGRPPTVHKDFESYKTAPTINHFHEKLLKVKGLMNTKSGKGLAEERHRFMLEFLDRFMKEWDGKA